MKIGQFASENNLSKDTIRYYMELGLIIAEKIGGQYSFDVSCQNQLNQLLKYKNMGFTLSEVKTILLYHRLGNLMEFGDDAYYNELFLNRKKIIGNEINSLVIMKDRLTEEIDSLHIQTNESNPVMGVGIDALGQIRCHKCHHKMILDKGNIQDNQVIKGELKCDCGEHYLIENGILIVKNIIASSYGQSNFMSDYLKATDFEYLDIIYKGINWLKHKLTPNTFKDSVILELGSGAGFSLRNVYEDLPDDCLYIAVDHDLSRHELLKSMLEKSPVRKNILFICCDFLEIPIKDKTIDIVFDFTGTSNFGFNNQDFLLTLTDNYVKKDAVLIGSYIIFKNFKINSLIEPEFRQNLTLDYIKTQIKNLSYDESDSRISDYMEKGGKFEDYFVHGEKVYNYSYYGKRWG